MPFHQKKRPRLAPRAKPVPVTSPVPRPSPEAVAPPQAPVQAARPSQEKPSSKSPGRASGKPSGKGPEKQAIPAGDRSAGRSAAKSPAKAPARTREKPVPKPSAAAPRREPRQDRYPSGLTGPVSSRNQPAGAGFAPGGDVLRVIPLGGMQEIGKNLTLFEFGKDMILVDCGLAFPEEDMPGIDIVIPDMGYLLQNRSRIRGVFLTHGHEDHIGSLPWLLKEMDVPVYGLALAVELVRIKLEDRVSGIRNARLIAVEYGDVVQAGAFSVEFIRSSHSIADASLLAIRCPAGIVLHTGDFKIDYTPINGEPIDLARLAEIGNEGVLLLMCESTNVERRGVSISESKVGESFADLFGKAPGRIIVATFSSNVHRMQQVFTAAERYDRKVALVGRSMQNVFRAADSLHYLQIRPGTLIDIQDIDRYRPDQVVIITTGSQGEPLAALTRMAFSEHRMVEIGTGDTVIISATPIPGNEKPIYRVINELFKRGANVIYESLADVHVSGHAYQEELKLMHRLVRPRFFVPSHGEFRHLYQHAQLANRLGMPWESIFLLANGDILELSGDGGRLAGVVPASGVLIDGSGMGDVGNIVLRDRRLLADDGVMAVSLVLQRDSDPLVESMDIQTRGFIYEAEEDRITAECRNRIDSWLHRALAPAHFIPAETLANGLRDMLRDFLFGRTKRRPIILVTIHEA